MPFTKRALTFFRNLKRNNNKPWLQALLPLVRWLNGALGNRPATSR